MTNSQMQVSRGQDIGEFAVAADGALTKEVRVIADKSLTKSDVLILIRRAAQRLLQIDIPRV